MRALNAKSNDRGVRRDITAETAIVEDVVEHITRGVLVSTGLQGECEGVVSFRATSYEIRHAAFTEDHGTVFFELAVTLREFIHGEPSGNTSKVLVIGTLVLRGSHWEVEEMDVGGLQSGLWLPSNFSHLH